MSISWVLQDAGGKDDVYRFQIYDLATGQITTTASVLRHVYPGGRSTLTVRIWKLNDLYLVQGRTGRHNYATLVRPLGNGKALSVDISTGPLTRFEVTAQHPNYPNFVAGSYDIMNYGPASLDRSVVGVMLIDDNTTVHLLDESYELPPNPTVIFSNATDPRQVQILFDDHDKVFARTLAHKRLEDYTPIGGPIRPASELGRIVVPTAQLYGPEHLFYTPRGRVLLRQPIDRRPLISHARRYWADADPPVPWLLPETHSAVVSSINALLYLIDGVELGQYGSERTHLIAPLVDVRHQHRSVVKTTHIDEQPGWDRLEKLRADLGDAFGRDMAGYVMWFCAPTFF